MQNDSNDPFVGITRSDSYEGKYDEGVPIYVTGKWAQGVMGNFDELFNNFRKAGFGCYRWDKPAHVLHGALGQYISVTSFFREKCKAFVFMVDEGDVYEYGTSRLLLGDVFALGIPVYFVDPRNGKHVRDNNECRDHKILANYVAAAAKLTNKLHLFDTMDDAMEAMRRDFADQLGEGKKRKVDAQ